MAEMEKILGRLQSEPDENGVRDDIHLVTEAKCIILKDGTDLTTKLQNMGWGFSTSKTRPNSSTIIWFEPVNINSDTGLPDEEYPGGEEDD